jgi:hypothetical protein
MIVSNQKLDRRAPYDTSFSIRGIDRRDLIMQLRFTNGSDLSTVVCRLPPMIKYNPLYHNDYSLMKEYNNIEIKSTGGSVIVVTDVAVIMKYIGNKPKRGTHRIFIKCLHCKRLIPFGRYIQHIKRKDHNQ